MLSSHNLISCEEGIEMTTQPGEKDKDSKCDLCTLGNKADAVCMTCVKSLCLQCIGQHSRINMFSGHIINDFDKVKDEASSQHSSQQLSSEKETDGEESETVRLR